MVFDKKARETRIELGMEGVQGRKIRTLCQLLVWWREPWRDRTSRGNDRPRHMRRPYAQERDDQTGSKLLEESDAHGEVEIIGWQNELDARMIGEGLLWRRRINENTLLFKDRRIAQDA